MSEELKQNIETFFRYFEHILDTTVNRIQVGENSQLFQILICSGIIDTLAKCAARPKAKNYERFCAFIKNFCEWGDCNKISLPHLVRFLQVVPSLEFESLRKFAFDLFDKWGKGRIIYLDSDPSYEEIVKLWPKDNELKEPIEKIKLDSLTHLHLVWELRNSVVHEMRLLGYGSSALVSNNPGYHQMTNYKDEQDNNPLVTWELVYPIPFFIDIIKKGIKNLKTYHERNRLDPFDRFEFGTYWLGEFNKVYRK